ncbi:uncharacterized protein BYT42DRAFT_570210 [Radiomyces spectabilis]|uniref:uncharacterized protein n=1 Tax=Radiomyces spectabilis TaxID=64574 RepID=UPI00221F0491|nr:uncharacterized protein BYT42DRAFT_570210 [Radiomyces spectabilis]KAI8377399.1 hypothetical protein BYT42DRAFT_570210 [Radiomyces spectabilis]
MSPFPSPTFYRGSSNVRTHTHTRSHTYPHHPVFLPSAAAVQDIFIHHWNIG